MRREEQAGLLSVLLQYLLLTHTVKVQHQTVCIYLSKLVSRTYVTSQYECQSIFNSPLAKVGSNALEGCSYENWLDVCGTVVSIGRPQYT